MGFEISTQTKDTTLQLLSVKLYSQTSQFWMLALCMALLAHVLLLWKLQPWLEKQPLKASRSLSVDLMEISLPPPAPALPAPAPPQVIPHTKKLAPAKKPKVQMLAVPKAPEKRPVLIKETIALEELIQEKEAALSMKNLKSASKSPKNSKSPKKKGLKPDSKPESKQKLGILKSLLKAPVPLPASPFKALESNYFLKQEVSVSDTATTLQSVVASALLAANDTKSTGSSASQIPPPPGSSGAAGHLGEGFFSLNSYNWAYESYMGRWAKHLRYAWNTNAPFDYMSGQMPQGGDVFVLVTLGKDGNLKSYEVTQVNGASLQMENSVVNAILESAKMPALPQDFQEDSLVVHFRFIYPALSERLR